MAHLIRPWQVRYKDKQGSRCRKGTPGAKKVRQRARKWYGAGIPGNAPDGKPYGDRRVPLASDKNVARQMLADLVRKAERGEAGLEDKATDAAAVPLSAHLESWERSLRNGYVGDKQVKLLLTRVRAVNDACGFRCPPDLNAPAVLNYLADRRKLPRSAGGVGIQTSNFYLSAMHQFCAWLCGPQQKRMRENPFAGVERGNVKLDRRHDRRDLGPDELGKVLDAARASKRPFKGLSGEDRWHLYCVAAGTGFRVQELASLTPESFRLDDATPTVVLAARKGKNRKPVVQPIPAALVGALRAYLKGREAGRPVWPGWWWEKAAKMLRRELEAVGIPYEVKGPDGPLFADFHSLRHSFITWLERSGATPHTAKELARHSDIRLTLGRYTHSNLSGLADAVNKLPLPGAQDERPNLGDFNPDEVLAVLAVAWAALAVLTAPAVVALPVAPWVAPEIELERDASEPNGTAGAKGRGE